MKAILIISGILYSLYGVFFFRSTLSIYKVFNNLNIPNTPTLSRFLFSPTVIVLFGISLIILAFLRKVPSKIKLFIIVITLLLPIINLYLIFKGQHLLDKNS